MKRYFRDDEKSKLIGTWRKDLGLPHSLRGTREESLTRTENVIREKCTSRARERRLVLIPHGHNWVLSSVSRTQVYALLPSSTSVRGEKKRFVSLREHSGGFADVSTGKDEPTKLAEGGGRKRERGGGGKRGSHVTDAAAGCRVTSDLIFLGASASLPPSISSVRSSVCPRVYRPTLPTPIFDIPRCLFSSLSKVRICVRT